MLLLWAICIRWSYFYFIYGGNAGFLHSTSPFAHIKLPQAETELLKNQLTARLVQRKKAQSLFLADQQTSLCLLWIQGWLGLHGTFRNITSIIVDNEILSISSSNWILICTFLFRYVVWGVICTFVFWEKKHNM